MQFAAIARLGRACPRWLRTTCCVLLAGIASVAHAADVVVVGLFAGKAVVVINGGAPRTLSVGQVTPEGVRLLAAKSDSAEFEIDGKRQVLGLGEHYARAELDATIRDDGSVEVAEPRNVARFDQ